jgi:hypothetical protein
VSKIKKKAATGGANDDYAVGYGKPPKKSQFAKGKSGNPSGRPKGSKNTLSSAAQTVFGKKVPLTFLGQSAKVPMVEALLAKIVISAMNGNPTFMKMALELYDAAHAANDNTRPANSSSFDLTDEQWAAIAKSSLLKDIK